MTVQFKLLVSLSFFMALSFSSETMARRLLLNAAFQLPSVPNFTFPSLPWIPVVYYVDWDFNIKDWTTGKTFHAGDILVFNYNRNLHNVVTINETKYEEYLNCVVADKARVFSTGNDAIILQNGVNYFICGTMGHCFADSFLPQSISMKSNHHFSKNLLYKVSKICVQALRYGAVNESAEKT